jgi:hypothetical protein
MRGFINNGWDRDNLEFLLGLTQETLKDWYDQADADDLVYAQELMNAYSKELHLKSQELVIEAEMMLMDQYPDAHYVIDKIRR